MNPNKADLIWGVLACIAAAVVNAFWFLGYHDLWLRGLLGLGAGTFMYLCLDPRFRPR